MTVVMFCLREPPPRDEQPMMAARALATLRAHFVLPTSSAFGLGGDIPSCLASYGARHVLQPKRWQMRANFQASHMTL